MASKKVVTYASRKRKYASLFGSPGEDAPSLITPPTSSPRALQATSGNTSKRPSLSKPPCRHVTTPRASFQAEPEKARTASPLAKRSRNSSSLLTARGPKHKVVQAPKKMKLTQMTIDLGGNPQKRCKECQMEYIPTNVEDAKMHKEYHAAAVGGVDVPSGVKGSWRVVARCEARHIRKKGSTVKWRGRTLGNEDVIVEVDRKDKLAVRRWVKKVLDVVERELGSVETGEDVLWNLVERDGRALERFKVYLYVQGSKCVGCCLAQRIFRARQVTASGEQSADIQLAEEAVPVPMGISRIWVSKDMQRLGIATELMTSAVGNFVKGSDRQKSLLAFSQPTDSGMSFAKSWSSGADGWMVYDEWDGDVNT